MKFIKLDKDNCDNCYKCLRVCPTKAISFTTKGIDIVDNKCIKCGRCQAVCGKEVISIISELDEIKRQLQKERPVVVSIAPSFISAFNMNDTDQMVTALKRLGFKYVEETAVGAEIISLEYEKFVKESSQEVMITSCCPSASLLIESHYPDLIQYMVPVVSPMIAHGMFIKERYDNPYVVFIGPCLAKIAEACEVEGAIDSVITFKELSQWFKQEGIKLSELDPQPFDLYGSKRGKAFPVTLNLDESTIDSKYRYIKVDGINRCKSVLDEIANDKMKNCCIEIDICDGSCINGPEMPLESCGAFEREIKLRESFEHNKKSCCQYDDQAHKIDVSRSFSDKRTEDLVPSQRQLSLIMMNMGKYCLDDEINCGACGYESCREKAIAIHNNHAHSDDCMIYLRNKAESIKESLIDNSPNGICTVGQDYLIKTHNPKFYEMFNRDDISMKDLPIDYFFDKSLFDKVLVQRQEIKNLKVYDHNIEKYLYINIFFNSDHNLAICFFSDITSNEKKKEELERVKAETIIKTQEVIDNQMRVAQEIAGLLGETTAETKMSLKSLKELVMLE